MACCINLTYEIQGVAVTDELTTAGVYGGSDYFEFTIGPQTYFIWYNATAGQWLINDLVGHIANTTIIGGTKEYPQSDCPPNGAGGQGIWELPNAGSVWDNYMITECVVDCPCLKLTIQADGFPEQTIISYNYFIANGRKHFRFEYNGIQLVIYFNGAEWQI